MKPFTTIAEHHQDLLSALQHMALLPLQAPLTETMAAKQLGLEGSIKLLKFQEALLKVTQHRLMTHLMVCTKQRAWDLALELLDTLQSTLEKHHAWQGDLTLLKAEVLQCYAKEAPAVSKSLLVEMSQWMEEVPPLTEEDRQDFQQTSLSILHAFTFQWKQQWQRLLSPKAPVSMEHLKQLMIYTKALVLLGAEMAYPLSPTFKKEVLDACEGLMPYQTYPLEEVASVPEAPACFEENLEVCSAVSEANQEASLRLLSPSFMTHSQVNERLAELVQLLAKDDLSRGALHQGLEGYRQVQKLKG